MRGLLITGTDTGVGKTHLTALIVREMRRRGLATGAYKPACSGSETTEQGETVWPDLACLRLAVGGNVSLDWICPQRFHAPLAPPVAAVREGRAVNPELLRSGLLAWQGVAELVVIEGVGGLLCPLTETETVADLAVFWNCPLIVVARLGLGTINHTLLTVEAAQRRGLTVAGIVLNDIEGCANSLAGRTNPGEISRRTAVPLLGVIAHEGEQLLSIPGGVEFSDGTGDLEEVQAAMRGNLLRLNQPPITIDWLAMAGEIEAVGSR